MKKTAAFFDIDGTLYRDSLMVEHFKKLIRYEIVDEKVWLTNARDTFVNWDKRQGNYDDYLFEVCDIYVESLKGLDLCSIHFTSNQVIKLKSDRVYKYTRSQIKWHLDQGHIVIFISGSPDFLEDGKFNGEVIPMWDSASKNVAINDFVEKYNIDLSKSYAYGDTNGDINMLRRVGNPVAINPTKELLHQISNDENIKDISKIIIERKDLVYQLPASVDVLDI